MSPYIRRYAKYLNEKAFSYRQMAFDFCKVKRGFVEPFYFLIIIFIYDFLKCGHIVLPLVFVVC